MGRPPNHPGGTTPSAKRCAATASADLARTKRSTWSSERSQRAAERAGSDQCCSIGSVPGREQNFESSAAGTRANPPSRANAAVKCSRIRCRSPAFTVGPALFVYSPLYMGVVRRLLVPGTGYGGPWHA